MVSQNNVKLNFKLFNINTFGKIKQQNISNLNAITILNRRLYLHSMYLMMASYIAEIDIFYLYRPYFIQTFYKYIGLLIIFFIFFFSQLFLFFLIQANFQNNRRKLLHLPPLPGLEPMTFCQRDGSNSDDLSERPRELAYNRADRQIGRWVIPA